MRKLTGFILGAALLTAGCGDGNHDTSGNSKVAVSAEEKRLVTPFIDREGKTIGHATLTEDAEGVAIKVEAANIATGTHGIHIHERGVCTPPDFRESAGAHFNPTNKEHGFENPKGFHLGDLDNVEADVNGHVSEVLRNSLVTLRKGQANSLLDGEGTALVIHEKADDYKTDPAGNSGTPIACAEITKDMWK